MSILTRIKAGLGGNPNTPGLLPEAMAGHWRMYEGVCVQGTNRGKGTINLETDRVIPGVGRTPDQVDNVYWHFCDEGVPLRLSTIFGWDAEVHGDLVLKNILEIETRPFKEYLRLNVEDLRDRTSPEKLVERAVEADEWLSSIGLIGIDLSNPDGIIRAAEEGLSRFTEAGFDRHILA